MMLYYDDSRATCAARLGSGSVPAERDAHERGDQRRGRTAELLSLE